ncbi:unnamed protein product [Closterium sp. NIES-53]
MRVSPWHRPPPALHQLAAAHLLPLPPCPAHPPAAAGRGGGGSSGWEAAGGGGAVVAYMDLDARFPMPRFMHVLHARAMQCVLDAHEGSPLQACEQQQQQQRVEGLVQAALRRFHLLPCRNTCHWLACLKSVSSLLPVWRAQQHEHRPGVGKSSAGVNAGVGAGATDGHAGEQAERMESVGAGKASGLQGEQRGGAGEVAMQHGGAEVAQWSWFSPAASAGQQSMSCHLTHCPPLLLIDSIGAFYWLDRAVPPAHAPSDHGGKLLTWVTAAEVAARELQQLSQSHGVAVVAARTAIFGACSLPPAAAAATAAAARDPSNVPGEAAAPVVPVHVPPREYMPAAWQAIVSHRLSLAGPFSPSDPLQPSQSQCAPSELLPPCCITFFPRLSLPPARACYLPSSQSSSSRALNLYAWLSAAVMQAQHCCNAGSALL